ncbi:MAG: PAS domain S-box protein, partial [Nitrospinales bacterium]
AFPGAEEGSVFESHYFPLYGEGEKIIGGMAILRNLTDRSSLEHQLQEIKDNGHQADREIQNKESEIEQLRMKVQQAEGKTRELEEAVHLAQEENMATQQALFQAKHEASQATLFASELINSNVDGILALDRDFRYTVWNTEMERISGQSKDSVLGRSAVEIFPSFKENGEEDFFKNALQGKTIVANRTYPFLGEDNEDIYEVHYSPLYGDGGEIVGVIAVLKNITENLQVAEKLIEAKENQNRLEQALREKDEEIRRTEEEIRQAKELARMAEQKSMQSEDAARRTQDNIHRLENEVRHAREFSEQLEHEIRENSEQYRQIFSIDPDPLVIIDLETGTFTEFNQSALDLYGYSREDFMKLQITDLSAESDNSLATLKEIPEGKVSSLGLHYHKKKDGTIMPVDISYGTFRYHEHRFVCATIKDVTVRKQAEEAYGESEQRLKSILDNTQAAIYIKDSQGRYMLINRKYQSMVNISNEEARGKTDHDIFPREIADAFRANDQKVLDTLAPLQLEEVALHNDGVHIYSSIKFPLRDSVGIPYAVCGIAFDITELKRAETELRKYRDQTDDLAKKQAFQLKASQDKSMQTEKILATSKFAASIARQFSTTLSAVYNVLEHFEERVQLDETHKGLLKLAIKNCAQVNELTKKLQNLDLSSSARLVSLDINQALGKMIPQLKKDLLEEKITLETHFSIDIPETAADEEQIQNAVMNLIRNAEEAISDQGGAIKIVTEVENSD